MIRWTFILAVAATLISCTKMASHNLWTGVTVGKLLLRVNGSTTDALVHTTVSFAAPYELQGTAHENQLFLNAPDAKNIWVKVIEGSSSVAKPARMGAPGVEGSQKVLVHVFEDANDESAGFVQSQDNSLEKTIRIAIRVSTVASGHYTILAGGPGLVEASISLKVEQNGAAVTPSLIADALPQRTNIEDFINAPVFIGKNQNVTLITLNEDAATQTYSGSKVATTAEVSGSEIVTKSVLSAPVDADFGVAALDKKVMFKANKNAQANRGQMFGAVSGSLMEQTSEVSSVELSATDQLSMAMRAKKEEFQKTYQASLESTAVVYVFQWSGGAGNVLASNGKSSSMASAVVFGTPKVLTGDPNGTPPLTNHEVLETFRNHDLALAVRGAACITCHGIFNGTVVTDGGHGNDYFMGGGSPGGGIYGVHAPGIHTARFFKKEGNGPFEKGKIIVPPAPFVSGTHTLKSWLDSVTHSNPIGFGSQHVTFCASYSRDALCQDPNYPFYDYDENDNYVEAPPINYETTLTGAPLATYREKKGIQFAPKPMVEEREVYIGAPTEAEIRAAAGTMPAEHPEWKYLSDAPGEPLAGLRVVSIPVQPNPYGYEDGYGDYDEYGTPTPTPTAAPTPAPTTKQYVSNESNQPLKCNGDLFITTSVVFKNLVVDTGNHGCRLYVVGSVFLMGPITYLGSAVTRHIQITSDRMIAWGMGFNEYGSRMLSYAQTYQWHDRRPGTIAAKMSALVAEAQGFPLEDATVLPGRLVNMERVILNAPQVHSRNMGRFEGVIIAEVALMAVGAFEFKSPEFIKLGTFPLFPRVNADRILKIGPVSSVQSPVNTPIPTATPTEN